MYEPHGGVSARAAVIGPLLLALVLPDRAATPGAITPVAASVVCHRGFARSSRLAYEDPRWQALRVAVFTRYGIPPMERRNWTLDHLVPLELSGANEATNIWPEPIVEAAQKDAVENALHAAVCYRRGYRGLHLSLSDAQRAIATDWTHTPVGIPAEQ